MSPTVQPASRLTLAPTGIAGLDTVLTGGLYRPGAYLLAGPPGSGKTILANQLCFHHAARGERVLYVTLLAESHGQMLAHLHRLAFFDPPVIGDSLLYLSGASALEQGGLLGLLDLLRRELTRRRPRLLVLDDVAGADDGGTSAVQIKRFIMQLQAILTAFGSLGLLVKHGPAGNGPEETVVDGVLELHRQPVGARMLHQLEVHKLRGSHYVEGRHFAELTPAGLVVYPRLESLPIPAGPDDVAAPRRALGIAGLDERLGGAPASSITVLMGPPGAGKTMLGLHFLAAGAAAGEPGLLFSFYHSPARARQLATEVGLDLADAVECLRPPAVEWNLDQVGDYLLTALRRRVVRRLVLDGLDGLAAHAVYPERLGGYLVALGAHLRAAGVTTLLTTLPLAPGSALDTVLALKMGRVDGLLELAHDDTAARRRLTIRKWRSPIPWSTTLTLDFTDHGIELAS